MITCSTHPLICEIFVENTPPPSKFTTLVKLTTRVVCQHFLLIFFLSIRFLVRYFFLQTIIPYKKKISFKISKRHLKIFMKLLYTFLQPLKSNFFYLYIHRLLSDETVMFRFIKSEEEIVVEEKENI